MKNLANLNPCTFKIGNQEFNFDELRTHLMEGGLEKLLPDYELPIKGKIAKTKVSQEVPEPKTEATYLGGKGAKITTLEEEKLARESDARKRQAITANTDNAVRIAKTLTPEEARAVIKQLDNAPGDNPIIRKAIAQEHPDIKTEIPESKQEAKVEAPKTTTEFRVGDVVKDNSGRKGVIEKSKDSDKLFVRQDKTQAQIPLSDKWQLSGKRPLESESGLRAGDVVQKKDQIGKVYERAGELRVKFNKDDKPHSEPLSDKWTKAKNTEAGAVSTDLLTLGLGKTAKEDVIPKAQEIGKTLIDSGDDIKKAVFASSRGEASQLSAGNLRKELASAARSFDIATTALKEARNYFAKNPIEDNYNFIGKMENGDISSLPVHEQTMAQALRKLLDDARQRVQDLGTGKLDDFIENYFPHIWKDPKEAGNFFAKLISKRPFEGSKSFLKQRVYNTFQEGLDAGLEPRSDNPVDLALLKIKEMDRYVAAHRTLNYLKDNGLAKFVRIGDKPPDGYIKINDKISDVRYRTENGELAIAGHYYAAEPAANIINNHLSPGLTKYSGYRAVRYAGNLINQFQLGFSAFHAMFTTIDAVTSKAALAVKQLATGHPLKAAKSTAELPVSWLTNLIRGDKVYREWMTPGSTDPLNQEITRLMVESGARAKMDDFYHTRAANRMLDAFKKGNLLGGIVRMPFGAVDLASRPLMEYLVPRQKFGVAADMMKHTMERLGADATPEEIRREVQKDWDSVDNRMGQLVYDNLFWNKTAKDLAMISVRSVGWNLGSFREIGGGAKDVVTLPFRLKRILAGSKEEAITNRMAYVAALPVITGVIGAMTQYLFTGKGPSEWKDYFFPKTGNTDENGNPERLSLPTYIKDIYAYTKHPVRTLTNKTNPLISLVSQMLENKDYFGTEIRHADDPLVQQLKDEASFVGKTLTPFGVQGLMKEQQRRGTTVSKIAPFFGFTPAPKDVNNTAAEEMLSDIQAEHRDVGSRTKEQALKSQTINDFVRQMRLGNNISEEFKKAVDAHILSPKDMDTIRNKAKSNYLVYGMSRLQLNDALKVYEVATDTEKSQLKQVMLTKVNNQNAKGALKEDQLQKLKELGLSPTRPTRAPKAATIPRVKFASP